MRETVGCALAGATLLVAGCAARWPPSAPLPAAAPLPDDGALHVALTWAAPVDLDLYVTDPTGESLYFGNRRTRAGAVLADDTRCGSAAAGAARLEEARLASPVPGRYRVGVDFIDACGAAVDAVAFRVTVGRSRRQREVVSVIRPGEFAVVVLEFELSEDGTLMEEAAHPVAAGLVPAPHRRLRQDAPCEQTDAGIAQPLHCVAIEALTQRWWGAATRAATTAPSI